MNDNNNPRDEIDGRFEGEVSVFEDCYNVTNTVVINSVQNKLIVFSV